MENQPDRKTYSLFELNTIIKSVITLSLPDTYWVTAEIAELKANQKGHCYLELIEKKDDAPIAQTRANIWAYDYRNISLAFRKATGEPLRPGMKVMLLATVSFHEVYGMSLNIRNIDPAYTMGEMARKKKEVIERLKKEGILELNKTIPLPLVPQRVAVISSPTAAGYGDFFNQLDNNPYGYSFIHILFPAVMQGQEAEKSIISALRRIKKKGHLFDVAVIIRGGGSATDLNCFDSYTLAAETARLPLPVITGIGHEKDDTVTDIVAHTKMKTPTAVAEFLISGLLSFEERVMGISDRVVLHVQRTLKDEGYLLNSMVLRLAFIPDRISSVHRHRLVLLEKDLTNLTKEMITKKKAGIDIIEQAVRHLDPENVLKRGYSITRHKGRILRDAASLKKWAVIETILHKGNVTSIVQEKKETKKSDQEQTAVLLPGFERA